MSPDFALIPDSSPEREKGGRAQRWVDEKASIATRRPGGDPKTFGAAPRLSASVTVVSPFAPTARIWDAVFTGSGPARVTDDGSVMDLRMDDYPLR
jgi:hypothetical protein